MRVIFPFRRKCFWLRSRYKLDIEAGEAPPDSGILFSVRLLAIY